MKIWLDDCRKAPEGWTAVFHSEDVKTEIERCQRLGIAVDELSLDNDLGLGEPEGRTVLDWLEEKAFTEPEFILPRKISVHSANPCARARMEVVIGRLQDMDRRRRT